MRVAMLSDIHGNRVALEAALADLQALGGADQTWFLGDFAAFGPRPAECVQHVRALIDEADADEARKGTVKAIRGNTDRYLVFGERMRMAPAADTQALAAWTQTQRVLNTALLWGMDRLPFDDYAFLSRLPGEIAWRAPGFGPVVAYHGVPGNDETNLTADTPDSVAADALMDREGVLGIGGHIHRQFDRLLPGTPWRIVNIGSVGMSFDQPGFAQWGLFTFEDGAVTVNLRAVPYAVEAVVADLNTVDHPAPDWLAGRLRNGV